MAYFRCRDCGFQIHDGATFCPSCGAEQPASTDSKMERPPQKPRIVLASRSLKWRESISAQRVVATLLLCISMAIGAYVSILLIEELYFFWTKDIAMTGDGKMYGCMFTFLLTIPSSVLGLFFAWLSSRIGGEWKSVLRWMKYWHLANVVIAFFDMFMIDRLYELLH